jgi:signal transduction histidine kinase/ligand-binding sensor domain-containing protein
VSTWHQWFTEPVGLASGPGNGQFPRPPYPRSSGRCRDGADVIIFSVPAPGFVSVIARTICCSRDFAISRGVLNSVVVGLLYLFLCAPAAPSTPISSFSGLHHTGWGVSDGVPPNITDLAQTADGYLWIGTAGGLYRFDGVRFERFQPLKGQGLLSEVITALLAQPDGGLWVGYLQGGATLLKDGRLRHFGESDGLAPRVVSMLARDPTGAIWAATALGLKRFEGSHWDHIGSDWNFPGSYAERAYVDRNGTLWVSTGSTIVFLPKGERRFHSSGLQFHDLVAMARARDGALWTSGINGTVFPLRFESPDSVRRGSPITLRSIAIAIDHTGMLWVPTTSDGVWRFQPPPLTVPSRATTIFAGDRFAHSDGLTANESIQVLEDSENNVWIATSSGLDRFRPAKMKSVTLPPGARGVVISATEQSGVFVSTGAVAPGILHVDRDKMEPIRGAPAFLSCAYRSRDGTLWFGGMNALWKYAKGRFTRVPLPSKMPPFREMQVITEGSRGDLWIAATLGDLYRFGGGEWKRFGGLDGLPHATPLVAYTDSLRRVWFGYEQNKIVVLEGEHVRSFAAEQGVKAGNITAVCEKDGEIWVGGSSGLQRFAEGRFQTVTAASGAFEGVSGIVERSNGDLWLNQNSGVVRISHAEIERFKTNFQHPVRMDTFTTMDGMPGAPYPSSRLPSAVESPDGSLWFSTSSGLVWIDPDDIPLNRSVPTVLIQSVTADDRTYREPKQLSFPNRLQNLAIRYTALSLAMPERVRFRYMLENYDKDWQEAGTRREAFYPQLPPGNYRFRVVACNNDDVWNLAGSACEFSVAPAYYQRNWFRFLAGVLILLLLSGAYKLRLQSLGRQLQVRYEERLAERTRIARELHDTLLQSFQGLIFRFQAVRNMLPEKPEEAVSALETAIDRAAKAITEGRDAVQELRNRRSSGTSLVEVLTAMTRELEADHASTTLDGSPTQVRITVEGTPRKVHPTVQSNLLSIAREALLNAFRHARAKIVELDIDYGPRILLLRVRDDGVGLDSKILTEGRRPGHYGLPGMRERARNIGGKFEFWSRIHQGTEVEVTVPGTIAFKSPSDSDLE